MMMIRMHADASWTIFNPQMFLSTNDGAIVIQLDGVLGSTCHHH